MEGPAIRFQRGIINGVPMVRCPCSHGDESSVLDNRQPVCTDCGERFDQPAGWLIDPALTDPD